MKKRQSKDWKGFLKHPFIVFLIVSYLTTIVWHTWYWNSSSSSTPRPNPYIAQMDAAIEQSKAGTGDYTPRYVINLYPNKRNVADDGTPPSEREHYLYVLKMRKCYLESKGWYVAQDGWGPKWQGEDNSYYIMAKENPAYLAAETARKNKEEEDRLQDNYDFMQFCLIAKCKQ